MLAQTVTPADMSGLVPSSGRELRGFSQAAHHTGSTVPGADKRVARLRGHV